MRRLAEQLGIKAPSLYKHLPDKAALEAAIIATGLEEAAELEQAVDSATTGGVRPGRGRRRFRRLRRRIGSCAQRILISTG